MPETVDVSDILASTKVELPSADLLSKEGSNPAKILLFGPSGSGKTHALAALVEAGERLFVVSTEPGGNGLVTLKHFFEALGTPELLTSIFRVDPTTYSACNEILRDPLKAYPALKKFSPTVIVWEGFSTFQLTQIDLEVMPDMLRPQDRFDYWDRIRRGTIRIHDRFLACGQGQWHHILTCHEDDPTEREGAGAADKKRALVQGSAKKAVYAGYDLILRMYVEEDLLDASKRTFRYQTGAVDRVEVKNRGFDIPSAGEMDMKEIWKKIRF